MIIGDELKILAGNSIDVDFSVNNITASRSYDLPDKDGVIALTSDIQSGGGGSSAKTVISTSSSRTISSTDLNNIIRCTSDTARAISIPSSNGFPNGSVVDVIQTGTGEVTVSAGFGVQLFGIGGIGDAVLIGQYARAQLIKLATNAWHITGDISI